MTRRGRGERSPDPGRPVVGGEALERLAAGARRILGGELPAEQAAAFATYVDLLTSWQRTYRLVGSPDRRWIVDELILDSLLFVSLLPGQAKSVLDFGSGAGIPGIPLAIVRPQLDIALLEARRRRASFLAAAVRGIGLANARVVPLRAEDALSQGPQFRAKFDVVLSRCSGRLRRVVGLTLPFLAHGGRLIVSGPPRAPEVDLEGRWVAVDHPGKLESRTFFVLDCREA